MDEKTYVIFDVSEINKINFTQVLETSPETLRKSIDGTKTFVKWRGDTPSFVQELTTKSELLNEEEMVLLMPTTEWHKPIENIVEPIVE
jgi:hypothetical protein